MKKPEPYDRKWSVEYGVYIDLYATPKSKRKAYDIRVGHKCKLSWGIDYSFEKPVPSVLDIILSPDKTSVLDTILEG